MRAHLAKRDEEVVSDAPSTRCPFCRGTITADASPVKGNPFVLHSLPTCKAYDDAEDALAFVKACNLELAKRRGVGLA